MNANLLKWKEEGYKYVIKGYDESTGEARYSKKRFKTRAAAEKYLENECSVYNSSLYLERAEVFEIDSLID